MIHNKGELETAFHDDCAKDI